MAQSFPSPTIIQPKNLSAHDLTIIILHGRGDDAPNFTRGFFSTFPSNAASSPSPTNYLRNQLPTVKWVFPSARIRYSTVFKQDLSEWFDIASLTDTEKQSEGQREGLVESVEHVRRIVQAEAVVLEERHGDASGRVILGGISMGCAVSVHVLLSLLSSGDRSVGGYFGWCGWLPFKTRLTASVSSGETDAETAQSIIARLGEFYSRDLLLANIEGSSGGQDEHLRQIPVFLSHCTGDGVVSVHLGREVRSALAQLDMKVRWTEYASERHWIKSPEAMDEFEQFLVEKVGKF